MNERTNKQINERTDKRTNICLTYSDVVFRFFLRKREQVFEDVIKRGFPADKILHNEKTELSYINEMRKEGSNDGVKKE